MRSKEVLKKDILKWLEVRRELFCIVVAFYCVGGACIILECSAYYFACYLCGQVLLLPGIVVPGTSTLATA